MALIARVGHPYRDERCRREGRRPPGDRATRRPGAQPDRLRPSLPTGSRRRIGTFHRGLFADRAGDDGQAGHAGQRERHGGPVLRASGPDRDGHGSGSGTGGHRRAEGGRNGHRGPPGAVRRTRDRGLPRALAAHPELLPGRPGGRSPGAGRLVFRTMVETGTARRSVGTGFGAAVRRNVLRHERSGLRRGRL